MHPEAIGTGAAKKGTELILRYGFEVLELCRIYLNVLNENERAVRFYEKLGFIYTRSTMIDFKGREKELRWYDATMTK
jgi:diamine N-acetyltransferase